MSSYFSPQFIDHYHRELQHVLDRHGIAAFHIESHRRKEKK